MAYAKEKESPPLPNSKVVFIPPLEGPEVVPLLPSSIYATAHNWSMGAEGALVDGLLTYHFLHLDI